MLALEDMLGKTEADVKSHIAAEYAWNESEAALLAESLESYDILVAYESVGSWGCDSSSWYLLRAKADGSLHTISGSHCSCYGFEGQGEIEPTDIAYLMSDRFYLPIGGYDGSVEENVKAVREAIEELAAGLATPTSSDSLDGRR